MIQTALIVIQSVQLVFLAVHDWIPLGPLNDLTGVRRENSARELAIVTLIGALPVAVSLIFTIVYFRRTHPWWALTWIWGTYVLLLLGAMRAWWVPYLIRENPARAQRFQVMFGNTHTFLPRRNGMAPNTLHVLFHGSLVITIVLLTQLA